MNHSRTFDLIAPSGYPGDDAEARRGIAWLNAHGHHVRHVDVTTRKYLRFAGTDRERAGDLNALADADRPLPDVALAVRGGYGAVRLLHGLDYDALQDRLGGSDTVICGHSDFTAIQMALLAQAGLTTFAGPMLCRNFGAEQVNRHTIEHFFRVLDQSRLEVRSRIADQPRVDVEGTLWGGNLAIITSLIATPYLPDIKGGILFVEDVNEHPFRVERMLYQLHLSGVLAQQQALVLGNFSEYRVSEYDNGYDLHAMIEQMRAVVSIPVVTGLNFGHTDEMLTLPVGANARLSADAGGFVLSVQDYPCPARAGGQARRA
jgi:muramoyltetrapeptide carboxypeptidase